MGLLRAWWHRDRVRPSPREGKLLRLAPGAILCVAGRTIEVHRRDVIETDGGAILRVADQGPGIDAEDQDRIFDRFVRGRRAQATHVRGSGIGLALVKHIAEGHGAEIRVESPIKDSESGTAFEILFPKTPPPKKSVS